MQYYSEIKISKLATEGKKSHSNWTKRFVKKIIELMMLPYSWHIVNYHLIYEVIIVGAVVAIS